MTLARVTHTTTHTHTTQTVYDDTTTDPLRTHSSSSLVVTVYTATQAKDQQSAEINGQVGWERDRSLRCARNCNCVYWSQQLAERRLSFVGRWALTARPWPQDVERECSSMLYNLSEMACASTGEVIKAANRHDIGVEMPR